MKLPNRERAVIAREKLTDYLLNTAHQRGGAKARLLELFGYSAANWQQLTDDIRAQIETEVEAMRLTSYGIRYAVRMTLETPSNRPLTVRTVWQVDEGTDCPRLITLYPD